MVDNLEKANKVHDLPTSNFINDTWAHMGKQQFMDAFKSMASHGVHLKVLKKFSDVIVRLLFSIYKKKLSSGRGPTSPDRR